MAVTPNRNRVTLSTVSVVVVSAPGPGVDRHVIGLKFPNLDSQSAVDIILHRNVDGTSRRYDKIDALAVGSVWNPADREHPIILKSADELIAFISATVSSPPDGNAEYIDKAAGGGLSATPTSAQFSVLSNAVSALVSAHDALSNRVSANSGVGGGGSVTSNELSAVSAQAASALSQEASVRAAQDSVLSNAVSAVSQALSVETAARVSADNALSNAVSVVSAEIATVSARTSTAGPSVQGLQSVINTLSSRISANSGIGGGGASVTSNEFSALEVRVSNLSAAPPGVSVTSTELSAVSATADANLSLRASVLSNTISVVGVIAVAANVQASTASLAATSADAHAAAASAAAASVEARLNSVVSAAISAIEVRLSTVSNVASNALSVANAASAAAAALSTNQSAISTKLSNTLSVASDARSIANVASAAVAALSLSHSALSTVVSALEVRVSTLSGLVASVSVRTSTAGASVKGLQSALNTLSNRISANSGGGGVASVTSTELSAAFATADANLSLRASVLSAAIVSVEGRLASVLSTVISAHSALLANVSTQSAGGSVKGIQSAFNALRDRVSANSGTGGAASVTSTELSIRVPWLSTKYIGVSNTQSTTASALTDISGMVLTVEASERWKLEGVVVLSTSAAGAGLRMGFSVPPLSTPRMAAFTRMCAQQSAALTGGAGAPPVSGSSIILSLTSITPAGAPYFVTFSAIMDVASAGTIRLMYAGVASTAASPHHVLGGTYMMAFRLK